MKSTLDAVERRITTAAARLDVLRDGLSNLKPKLTEEEKFIDRFNEYVSSLYVQFNF